VTAVAQDSMIDPTVAGRAPEAYVRDFDATLAATAEQPGFVRALRQAGLAAFARHGFPSTKVEDWHYTSVAPIAEADFLALTAPGGEVTDADVRHFGFRQAAWHTMVFVNGHFAPALSSLGTLPAGVRLLPLAAALGEMPELAERYLGQVTSLDGQANAFTALNTMYMTDGAVLHLAADTVVDQPIHLLFITDAMAARGILHPRNLIVADRHAKATVVESYVATGEAHYFTNAVTEIVVGDGATLTHLKLQRESQRAFHVSTTEATQARDSHFVSFSFGIGADLSRSNVYSRLGGAGCGVTLNGLYLLDGAQHMDHQTNVVHVEPNCYSRELYKGILDGRSHGVFNGKVYVYPEAQKTDGKQTNNTLLLSETAQIDTKPQLEIFADDVKCTHGATVGQIDQTALFYMKSRGVNATMARQLLTYAFAADALETIACDPIREGLEELTLKRYTDNS